MAHSVGTIFAEVGLDFQPYSQAQKRLLKEATSTTLNIEKSYKDLGIKSAKEFDLMRAKVQNAYNRITSDARTSADDIVRAEKAKAEQLKKINEEQFGRQTSLLESLKSNWLAYSAAAIAAVYAIKKTVDLVGQFTSAASDLSETVSKSNQIFGANGRAMLEWADDSATALGMSRQAALENAATLGNMFKQLGAGSETAAKNSRQMVQLAADIASFHNVSEGAAGVLNAMQAAFRGEYDALQRYIPTINAAAVQQKALSMTGKKAAEDLTNLEKAAAAQAIIMRDAGDATGDFARTSGGLANQQRILEANVTNLKATIGEALIPVATDVVLKLNEWIKANENLIGQSVEDWVNRITRGINLLADAYGRVKKIQEFLFPHSELSEEDIDWAHRTLGGRKTRPDIPMLTITPAATSSSVKGAPAPTPEPKPIKKEDIEAAEKYAAEYLESLQKTSRLEEELSRLQKERGKDQEEAYKLQLEFDQAIVRTGLDMQSTGSIMEHQLQNSGAMLADMEKKANHLSAALQDGITGWASGFSSSLADALFDAEITFDSIAKSFGKMIATIVMQKQIVEPFLNFALPMMGGGSSGPTQLGGAYANGAAFCGGNVIPFARGGVVSKPTLFPMARGMGLMGEAGPEGVLPLKRGASGRLGVEASGMGAVVNVNVVNNSGAKVDVQESPSADGGRDITILIDEAVGNSIMSGRGKTFKAMRQRFGASPTMAGR